MMIILFGTGIIWSWLCYMGALKYGKYTIVSEPRFDHCLGLWIPCAVAFWDLPGGLRFRRFFASDNTFAAQDEAVFFGILVARTWVVNSQKSVKIPNVHSSRDRSATGY
jgi:hypothetical protein